MPTEAEWADLEAKLQTFQKMRAEAEGRGILYAEKMGYDCGLNGANVDNCHLSIFAKPEWTKAWELGKKRGEADKQTTPQKGSI